MKTTGVGDRPVGETPAAGPGEPTPPAQGGTAFREVLERKRRDREEGDRPAPEGEPSLRTRGPQKAGGEAGPLQPFHLPPPVLHPPPPIVRPAGPRAELVEAAQAIADRVVQAVSLQADPAGRLEFVLDLRPEVLGGLEVRVRMEAGRVHALFAAQQPEVRAVIEAQVGVLRQALERRGLQVGDIEVADRQRPSPRWDQTGGGRGDANGGSKRR